MIQAWQDLMLWENFLNLVKPKAVIEIGTFTGGFSMFLHGQCYSRDATFLTVDFMEFAEFEKEDGALWINGVSASFLHKDCWGEDFRKILSGVSDDELNNPLIVYCDGGNKPREMQTFSKMLKKGQFMATHDWGNEIGDGDITGLPLKMIMKEECEHLGSLTRFFEVV